MEDNKVTRFSFSIFDFSDTKLLSLIYGDLAQPSVKKVGKALGTVFGLTNTLVTPVWMLNEFVCHKQKVFKENMQRYRDKVSEIPENKVCEVSPEIGVPIIEKLTYTINEQIRESYLNLLTNASSSETAMLAHPAFVGMIDRMSADEAKIINYINPHYDFIFIHFNLVGIRSGSQKRKRFATGIEFLIQLDFPNNMNVYLTNLMNLGIINYEHGRYQLDDGPYIKLRARYSEYEKGLKEELEFFVGFQNDPTMAGTMAHESDINSIAIEKGYFEVTDFGRLFIEACKDSKLSNSTS